MQNIINVIGMDNIITLLRIIVSVVLCSIIGLERTAGNKPAGFKTHILLGISATIIMLMGEFIAKTFGNDPTRLAAQILTGIGFIGAGTILRDGTNVKGLTTAASLLAVTCIGLTVGAGFYFMATVATILVFVVLKYTNKIAARVSSINEVEIRVVLRDLTKHLEEIEKVCTNYSLAMFNVQKNSGEKNKYEFLVNGKITNVNEVIASFLEIEGVEEVADTKEIG